MKVLTWYDFDKLSYSSKKEFLIKIKANLQKDERFSPLIYNKYAKQFGLEKIELL